MKIFKWSLLGFILILVFVPLCVTMKPPNREPTCLTVEVLLMIVLFTIAIFSSLRLNRVKYRAE